MIERGSIERLSLRRVSATLGYASVRLPDVHLTGFKIEERWNGAIRITPPTRPDRDGREWPVFALQPGTREAVEAEIRRAWSRSAP